MKKIDLETWNRKAHFELFSQFKEPFFGICTEVDCTSMYSNSRERKESFFIHYLYASLKAANLAETFRYRIKGKEVLIYDHTDASPTINREDGTFGFAYIPYNEDKASFYKNAISEIERVRSETDLIPALSAENVIHYSTIPWIRFTALSHARQLGDSDSIPKITFGKMTINDGRYLLPVSIHVHHALMDAWHVGQYLDLFQDFLNKD